MTDYTSRSSSPAAVDQRDTNASHAAYGFPDPFLVFSCLADACEDVCERDYCLRHIRLRSICLLMSMMMMMTAVIVPPVRVCMSRGRDIHVKRLSMHSSNARRAQETTKHFLVFELKYQPFRQMVCRTETTFIKTGDSKLARRYDRPAKYASHPPLNARMARFKCKSELQSHRMCTQIPESGM